MNKWGRERPTISFASVLIILCVLLSVFVIVGVYYMQVHQREATISQTAKVSKEALDAYIGGMDRAFGNLEAFMHDFVYDNRDIETLNRHTDEVNRLQSKQRITRTLSQIVRLSGTVECTWLYIPEGDEADFLARNAYTGISNAELLQIHDRIIGIIKENADSSTVSKDQWSLISTDSSDYLFWMTSVRNVYYGAWIRVSFLFEEFSRAFSQNDGSMVILSTLDGEPMIESDPKFQHDVGDKQWTITSKDIIYVTSFSTRANLAVSHLLTTKDILEDMHTGFDFALFASGMVIFVLVAVLLFQFLMYRPFFRINQALREIADGDLTIRLEKNSRLKEISALEYSINHLLDVINSLKIDVYENKLQQRNVTCQYLKIRLKTHFYLNCLSIIHALARVKNTKLIKELAVCLSNYLRFLDKDTDELVRLEDELSHVGNYAHIQELRFPDVFQYIEEVPPELCDVRIPPLILQTFIENSVEHAMLHDKKNWVRLRAGSETRNGLSYIRFQITDSGKGFDEETLKELSKVTVDLDFSQRYNIGIRNVISRLTMIYNGKAAVSFSNAKDSGAVIDMWLPIGDFDEEYY